jgi:hypothetical protein
MKNISPAFKEALAQGVTTFATCWKASLVDGSIIGFTDHTQPITFQGVPYESATGYIPTAIEASSMLNVDNLEVEAILDSALITERDLASGRWDYAIIEVFLVNWEDLTIGKMNLKTGTLGQVTMKQTTFVAEVRGLAQAYTNIIGEMYTPMCRAILGDKRCKLDLAPFTKTGTVQGIAADNRFIADATRTEPGPAGGKAITGISRAKRAVVTTAIAHGFLRGDSIFITGINGVIQTGSPDNTSTFQYGSGKAINGYTYVIDDVTSSTFSIPIDTRFGSTNAADGPPYADVYSDYINGGEAVAAGNVGYFDFGILTFTSGENKGLSMEIKSYVTGVIELQLPMPFPIAIGDTYTAIAGCGKRFSQDCKQKFNNVINFRGEPNIPGLDKVLLVGRRPQTYN